MREGQHNFTSLKSAKHLNGRIMNILNKATTKVEVRYNSVKMIIFLIPGLQMKSAKQINRNKGIKKFV